MTNIRHPAKSMGAQWRGRNGDPMIDPITTAPFISDPPVWRWSNGKSTLSVDLQVKRQTQRPRLTSLQSTC